jgi:UDP-N-acetylmuramyl pentapeptide phosphotransferase/UDP-N-acetylglucosamine-1-phosphate transferase
MQYISFVIVLFLIELVYFKIADHYNIIDKPNHRSSHTTITLRGGGILFPIAVLIAFGLGYVSIFLTFAVVLVAIVSFVDDVYPLPTLPRFSSHFLAVILVLYDLNLLVYEFWIVSLVLILVIGWINAFNFMDGINGITVLYAFVSIISFGYLYQGQASFSLLVIVGIATLVFGFFNVRKRAKTFAGDVGSISMAVFLAYFMVRLIFEKEQIGYLLFFSVYGIDAIVTILYRIKNKENIFKPHRSHLYQYLANELKWPHVTVSILYAGLQLGINGMTILLIDAGYMTIPVFLGVLVVLALLYLGIRISVGSVIKNQNG